VLTAAAVYGGIHLLKRQPAGIARILRAALGPFLFATVAYVVVQTAYRSSLGRMGAVERSLAELGILMVVCGAVGIFAARRFPGGPSYRRGARIVTGTADAARRPASAAHLTFAGEPIDELDETKHFKIIGTTGTGKSTVIRELLNGALQRGDRAVIADPDGSYLQQFYRPDRGDVILNPFDARSARWDLFAEIVKTQHADELARSLIPDPDGADRNWRNYARTFLTALLRQLHRAQEHNIGRLYWLLALAPADELRALLGATPAGPFLAEDNGKFFESVRAVANVHLAAIEHLAAQTGGELFSVGQWIRNGRGVLFLPYRASEVTALRNLISTWMRIAIFETLDSAQGDQRLWFLVDELDALGALDGLKDALARLRKFGGRCVLGFQSIAQVRGTYGDTEAQTIVENCGNTLILRCSASERGGTAEFASRLIGRREIVRQVRSRNSSPAMMFGTRFSQSSSDQWATEDAVMASEIEQLPDLAGYLKISSSQSWSRVTIRRP
jgi:hypothetical protein